MNATNGNGSSPISDETAAEFGRLLVELVELRDRVEALEALAALNEPSLDYHELAAHFTCGHRTVQKWKAEGMPMELHEGKQKGQLSKVAPWVEERRRLRRAVTSTTLASNVNGAGTADTAPRPTNGGTSDGSQ